jgi:hypothetical protein
MRIRLCKIAVVAVALCVVTWREGLSAPQFFPGSPPPQTGIPTLGHERGDERDSNDIMGQIRERQAKRLREEHQKQIFNDSTRLVQLATVLKTEADKGAKPTVIELKDVDEIARLAKKLSERIKTQ